jgi:hypothetical protein
MLTLDEVMSWNPTNHDPWSSTPGNNTWQLKCVPNLGGCLSVLRKTGNFPLQHLSRQPWTTPDLINLIPNLWSYPIVP